MSDRKPPKAKPPRSRVAGPFASPRADLEALLQAATAHELPTLPRATHEPERRVRLEIDLQNHSVYLRLREGDVARCEPVGPSARAYLDLEDRLLGIGALTPEELGQVLIALARYDRWRVKEIRALDRTLRRLPGLLA